MPKVDGFEVLRWARTQPGLDDLRVVVLTSSECIRDVNKAYRFGANSFLVKPMDFENTAELGKLIQEYWLDHSKPPESIRFPGLKLPTVDEVPEDPRDEINSELDRLHAAMEQNQKLLHEAQLRIEDLEAATQAQQIALATRKSLSLPTCARVVKPVE